MKKQAIGLLVLGCCLTGQAIAAGAYSIGRASVITFEDEEFPELGGLLTYDPGLNAEIGFGYDFFDFWGVEAIFSGSVVSGTLNVPGDEELDSDFDLAGLYTVFRTPGDFYLKAKAGRVSVEWELEAEGTAKRSSDSFGAGLGYRFNNGARLELEGVLLEDNDINDIYAYNVGITMPIGSPDGSSGIYRGLEESKSYWGANFGGGELKGQSGLGIDTNGIGFKAGREFGHYLSFEAHLGLSAESTDNVVNDAELTFAAAFFRVNLPFERVNLYAMGGVSKVKGDVSGFDTSEGGRAGGLGIDLYASELTALTIEKVRYGTDNKFEVLSLGITRRFDWPGLR